MRPSRRFVPALDALPLRLAPSTFSPPSDYPGINETVPGGGYTIPIPAPSSSDPLSPTTPTTNC